jgi:cytochrome c-type biogenesis protein CcmE
MKKLHIVSMLFIALSIAVIISSVGSADTYAAFQEAMKYEGVNYTVVGNLDKNEPIGYNPLENANLVEFYMTDKEGTRMKVILNQSKPQDFEKSEEIVVKGNAQGGVFYANTMLLKCPSKYIEKKEFNS